MHSGAVRAHGRAVGVAVLDLDDEVLAVAEALREVLGDRDGAVAAAGAADRDDQVRLALRLVLAGGGSRAAARACA